MKASWNIALGEASPALAVPWHDDDGRVEYVDLRAHPERMGEIPETRENPALAHVLTLLNTPGSPWATAKCDCWKLDEDDLQTAALDLDLDTARAGIGSYIDLYYRDAMRFASLEGHRDLIERLTRAAEERDSTGILELTLRHCVAEGVEGYAITAFLYAVGQDAAGAQAGWEAALTALMHILLSSDASAIE
jgi:hypothetical protein